MSTSHLQIKAAQRTGASTMTESTLTVDYSAFAKYLGKSEFIDCAKLYNRYNALVERLAAQMGGATPENIAKARALAKQHTDAYFALFPEQVAVWAKYKTPDVGAFVTVKDALGNPVMVMGANGQPIPQTVMFKAWDDYADAYGIPRTYQTPRAINAGDINASDLF